MPEVQQIEENIYQFKFSGEETTKDQAAGGQYVAFLLTGPVMALIEPGPTTIARLAIKEMEKLGYDPQSLDYVIPTHVHVDHAGGAGFLAKELPRPRFVAHERGARHMIDPERLIASTQQVFGPRWEDIYGSILPVPKERVIIIQGGETISLGGRKHQLVYTPGHSPHHFSIYDTERGILFCGEALGLPQPGTTVIQPTASPPSWDLDTALDAIRRLGELKPKLLLYSHWGISHQDPSEAIRGVEKSTVELTEVAEEAFEAGASAEGFRQKFIAYSYKGQPTPEDPPSYDVAIAGYVSYFQRKKAKA